MNLDMPILPKKGVSEFVPELWRDGQEKPVQKEKGKK